MCNTKVKGVIIFVMSGNEFKDKDLTLDGDFRTAVSTYVAACITTHDTYETVIIITPALTAYDTANQEGGAGPGYKKVVRAIEDMLRHARLHFLNADHLSADFKKNPVFQGPGADKWHVATQANLCYDGARGALDPARAIAASHCVMQRMQNFRKIAEIYALSPKALLGLMTIPD